jgi:hypothetical protein
LPAPQLAKDGEVDLLGGLFELGMPVNAADAHGESVLLRAAQHARSPAMQLCIQAGANLSHTNVSTHMTAHNPTQRWGV